MNYAVSRVKCWWWSPGDGHMHADYAVKLFKLFCVWKFLYVEEKSEKQWMYDDDGIDSRDKNENVEKVTVVWT